MGNEEQTKGRSTVSEVLIPLEEGYYWVVLGQNPPEIALWQRRAWWLCGDDKPWRPDLVRVISRRLVFRPGLRVV